jgi:hypothetical protein
MRIAVLLPCTASKHASSSPLSLRHIPITGRTDSRDRFDRWWAALLDRLEDPTEHRLPAAERYKGAGWQASQAVFATAQQLGRAEGLVVSAGLGLVNLTDPTPAYSSTFNAGNPDSVAISAAKGTFVQQNQDWWRRLEVTRERSIANLADHADQVLAPLPPRYVRAIEVGLRLLATRIPVTVYTTGVTNGPLASRTVRVQQALIRSPGPGEGASDATLIAKVAAWSLENLHDEALDVPKTQAVLDSHAYGAPSRERRVRASDEDVRTYLRTCLREERNPGTSRSRLHAEFRKSGRGCSSDRFERIFTETVAELRHAAFGPDQRSEQ